MDHNKKGHLHPITQTIREIYSVFYDLGFEIANGPELEDEFHNFDALNISPDHPARDMQDTFWIKSKGKAQSAKVESGSGDKGSGKEKHMVLRTHTSSVQIRYMEEKVKAGIEPPFRIVVPGKVFRNEATDATHEAQFYQMEALYVDKVVTVAHLKGVLETVFKKLFGPDVEIQFRPSFFAFTEPSLEIFMKLGGKWLEIGGSGLVHPNVFKAVGLDPKKWQGFAFGFGVDRIAMLKFGYDDVRLSYGGDLRFINQF